jgi:ring-1,2-phenylacetyl-CoA epoxidase subunit PaaD
MSETDNNQSKLKRVWEVLGRIPDPEIPLVSVVELGMIDDARLEEDGVRVRMTPTFAACPAIQHIRNHIRNALAEAGFRRVEVDVVFDPPWSTDRITPEGLEKLKQSGFAVPERMEGRPVEPADLQGVPCPNCNSTDTTLESSFGPTLCRSIHYCNNCLQSFEHFKPVSS